MIWSLFFGSLLTSFLGSTLAKPFPQDPAPLEVPKASADVGLPAASGIPLGGQTVFGFVSKSTDQNTINDIKQLCDSEVNRTPELWKNYKIGDWFKEQAGKWSSSTGGAVNIQQYMHSIGQEGNDACNSLSVDCEAGIDYGRCQQFPEAHFVIWAIVHFSNYLGHLKESLDTIHQTLDGYAGTMIDDFFTPREDPLELIFPVAIINSIFTALSLAYAPLALGSAVATTVSGYLTQKGLEATDPLKQWSATADALSGLYMQIGQALEDYWQTQLNTRNTSGTAWTSDPMALPSLFYDGYFAQIRNTFIYDKRVYSTLASAGINTLWNQDKVFIVKISNEHFKGTPACELLKEQTFCDNGVAYIFLRWMLIDAGGQTLIGAPAIGQNSYFDVNSWSVRGAYAAGRDAGKSDYLQEKYFLDLGVIARSAIRVQAEGGFYNTNQNGRTLQGLNEDIASLPLEEIQSWNLPVCDLDALLGAGKQFTDKTAFIKNLPCSCHLIPEWPLELKYVPAEKQCKSAWHDV